MPLTETERTGIIDIISIMDKEDRRSLARTVLNKLFTFEIEDETISAILTYTSNPVDFFKRKKVKKEVIFKYAVSKKVPTIKPSFSRLGLVIAVLKYWGSLYSDEQLKEDRQVIVSEILWFLFKNKNHLDDEKFKNEASDFFSDEEIKDGIKNLSVELSKLSGKSTAKSNLKGGNIDELINLVKLTFSEELSSFMPMFTIFNIERVPIDLAKNFNKSIEESLTMLNVKVEKNCTLIEQLNERFDKAYGPHVHSQPDDTIYYEVKQESKSISNIPPKI
ncbi:hypothetical protein HELRODRAFT_183518 [Helobdella robusta]|uniref:Uncharacterized protein n=1 Tax=Helobdella robusta TaxID=6412 RepID=T1FJS2_HELRO|nr:hypothetical protein HELRODRAFT_183518 [Helobdella robusta]ESO11131.1 hypothetical protein HELRODRAFT_183518 [Helobdella robusta]